MAIEKLERVKRNVSVGTIGHIDHGRTLLSMAIAKHFYTLGSSTIETDGKFIRSQDDGTRNRS